VSNAGIDFPTKIQPSITPFVGFALVWLVIFYSLGFVFDAEQIRRLSREDGVVEYIGAALFFLASVLYFLLYKNSRLHSKLEWLPVKGNVFYFLLAVAFLFVGMEEISWGQRIIGFETPGAIREMNAQSEFNLHNLDIFHGNTDSGERKSFLSLLLNMDRLFSMFWFSYCFLVPLIYRFSSSGRAFLKQLMMPIVPMSLGLVFVVNYAANKAIELVVPIQLHHSITEIKESNIAMLFFVLAVWFMRTDRVRKIAPTSRT
jgi:hypothetical protein